MSHLLPLSPESPNFSPTSKVEDEFILNCRANEKCKELGIDKLHDVEIIRFFQGAREDALKATNEIIDLLTWRLSIGYEEVLNGSYPEYCSTIFYLYDVSHSGIPVLFYKAKNYLPLVDDADALLKQSVALMGNIQREYNYSKVILCIDKDGASTDNVSVDFAKQTISLFTRYFPETLHELLIFQSNFLLWSFWSLIKPFMESDTVQKVIPYSLRYQY